MYPPGSGMHDQELAKPGNFFLRTQKLLDVVTAVCMVESSNVSPMQGLEYCKEWHDRSHERPTTLRTHIDPGREHR